MWFWKKDERGCMNPVAVMRQLINLEKHKSLVVCFRLWSTIALWCILEIQKPCGFPSETKTNSTKETLLEPRHKVVTMHCTMAAQNLQRTKFWRHSVQTTRALISGLSKEQTKIIYILPVGIGVMNNLISRSSKELFQTLDRSFFPPYLRSSDK